MVICFCPYKESGSKCILGHKMAWSRNICYCQRSYIKWLPSHRPEHCQSIYEIISFNIYGTNNPEMVLSDENMFRDDLSPSVSQRKALIWLFPPQVHQLRKALIFFFFYHLPKWFASGILFKNMRFQIMSGTEPSPLVSHSWSRHFCSQEEKHWICMFFQKLRTVQPTGSL